MKTIPALCENLVHENFVVLTNENVLLQEGVCEANGKPDPVDEKVAI